MLSKLLAQAIRGQITGLMYVAALPWEGDEMGMCGDFAEDRAYAVRAATKGFARLTQTARLS